MKLVCLKRLVIELGRLLSYINRLLKKRITLHISLNTTKINPFNLSFSIGHLLIPTLSIIIVIWLFSVFIGGFSSQIATHSKFQLFSYMNSKKEETLEELYEETLFLSKKLYSKMEFTEKMRPLYDIPSIEEEIKNVGVGGEIYGDDKDIINDTRIDKLAKLDRQVRLELENDELLSHKANSQNRIWKYSPTIKPTGGSIVSGFGWRRNPLTGGVHFHKGIDIVSPVGTPIVAPSDGVVSLAGVKTGYGYCVRLDHKYGFQTLYGHCSKLLVEEGDTVERGDIIALIGSTGWSIGPHLHYEVRINGVHVDPKEYIIPDYIED